MPRLTDSQRTAALAADVAAHKLRSARMLQRYLAQNENDQGRAIYIVATEADAKQFDGALIDTRCPDLEAWFGGNQRDVRSAQALLNKTDYKKRALAPEALAGYQKLVVEYVRVLARLNAMKRAKQTALAI